MEIGSVDWRHPDWVGSFYPETLPREWWLPYYSNEFACVLVAAEPEPRVVAGQWLADTNDRFRFYLRCTGADAAQLQLALGYAERLGERLGGVICDPPAAVDATCTRLAQELVGGGVGLLLDRAPVDHPWLVSGMGGCVWRPEEPRRGCASGLVRAPDPGERRALRAQIEAFAGQAGGVKPACLFYDGARTAEVLRDAAVISSLLGV